MATVTRKIADDIARGLYPEDRAFKIVEYENAWGGVGYGVMFEGDSPEKYSESEFVRNPKVYWEAGK